MTDSVVVPRWAVQQVLADLVTPAFDARQALVDALEQTPMWDRVRPLLDRFARVSVPLTPAQTSSADQLQQYTSNLFDHFGLDATDGRTTYTVVVVLVALSQLALNAHEVGQFTDADHLAVTAMCRAFGLALASTVPPDEAL